MQICWLGTRALKYSSFRPLFNFSSRFEGMFHEIRIFSTLKSKPSVDTAQLRTVNKKITQLIRNGRMEDAIAFFDKLAQRNTVTWNSILSGYVQSRQIAKARNLFDEMPERDVVSWNMMLSGYMSCRGRSHVEEGRYLFDKMPERDFVSWNTMIGGYAKNGRMDEALRLFNSMPERNVVTWNTMVSGFLQNGDVKGAIEFFTRMPKRDAASLSALVSGLIQNDELDKAADILFKYQKRGDREGGGDLVRAYNTLIAGYARKGRVEDARRLFDHIPVRGNEGELRFERNVVSWNSMIMCYVKAGDMISARKLFDVIEERDTFSWNTMISGYVHALDMKEATKLFSEMPNPDPLSWNSIISGFTRDGNTDLAGDFFDRMPQKTLISWNTIIAGCEENGEYKGGLELFLKMQRGGEKPDRHTLSSLLSICAETADGQLGMQIHQLVTKVVIPDIPLNNALITMYGRCGAIVEAEAVFDEMKFQRDVISWNAMIGGYASHGLAKEALELFELMKKVGVRPTHITFLSVLTACAHAGLVEKGRLYFRSMASDFGIEPRVEHYASLVDVVGRFGQVEEAMDVIQGMPIQPDKAVWGALLGACRVHNNADLAKVAAEALMTLEPESSGPYVLLYNMYADAGRWEDANEIRMLMDKNKIKKAHGYSQVDSSCS